MEFLTIVYLAEDATNRFALIQIDQVKKPQVWNAFNEELIVADNGYHWLIVSPKNENYVITMYMNKELKPIIWYIDMIDGQGTDEDGVFYYDDIFLDLLVSVKNEIAELDRDELEQALKDGVITEEQNMIAIKTSEKLKQKISSDSDWIIVLCQRILKQIKEKIEKEECMIRN